MVISVSKELHARKRRESEIGDLDTRIILHRRSMVAPKSGEVDLTEKFDKAKEVWANVATSGGHTVFTEAGTDVATTHRVIVRFDVAITSETWVELHDRRLKIITVENLDERSQYTRMRCQDRGSKTKAAAQA